MLNKVIIFCTLIFLIQSILIAEPEFSFKEHKYNLRQIISVIEDNSNYEITLPFADKANIHQELPQQKLTLKQTLNYISREFEKNNGQALNYSINGHKIHFQNPNKVLFTRRNEILKQGIRLHGKKLNIKAAINIAESQIKQKIFIPADDKTNAMADYNYKCTLEEFLEEIKNYYLHNNNQHLSYGVSESLIRFYINGEMVDTPAKEELKIEIMTQEDKLNQFEFLDEPRINPRKSEIIKNYSSTNAIDSKIIKSRAQKRNLNNEITRTPNPQKPQRDFLSTFNHFKSLKITHFLSSESAHHLVTTLIAPHSRKGHFQDLYFLIEPHLIKSKNFYDWHQKLLDLDLYPLNDFEKSNQIKKLEENWLAQILTANIQRSSNVTQKNIQYYLKIEAGFGSGTSKVGEYSRKPGYASSGQFLNAQIGLEHNTTTESSWNFKNEAFLEGQIGSGDAANALDQSALSYSFISNKTIGHSSITSISPFFTWVYESDLISASSIQSHHLFIVGNQFHWKEGRSFLIFDKTLADTEIFASKNQASGAEAQDYYSSTSRDSLSFGIIHHTAYLINHKNGYHGPELELSLIDRNSDSLSDKGLEYNIMIGYQYQYDKLKFKNHLRYKDWNRFSEVEVINFNSGIHYSPAASRHHYFINYEYENSESEDILSDYSSNSLKLGVELKW